MKIKIYQIDHHRDENDLKFMGLSYAKNRLGQTFPDSSIYNKVFDGEVAHKDLEEVYQLFNTNPPERHKGHSLSVSDVVEVQEAQSVAPGFYYCDRIGFEAIDFDPTRTKDATGLIRVVMVEPQKEAYITEIGSSLSDMQQAVGGYIEGYYPFEDTVCIVCNEEGKLNGMPLNRAVRDKDGDITDIIAGPFFVCDCSGENFGSLSPEMAKKYQEKFRYSELFYRLAGRVEVVTLKPAIKLER